MTFLIAAIMVKNEERNIAKTINSVKDAINGLVVLDTGCTDNTLDIIKEIVPNAEIYEAEFKDFSETRNVLLRHCFGKSEFILLLDAGDEVHNTNILLDHLKKIEHENNIGFIQNRFEIVSKTNSENYMFSRSCCIRNRPSIYYKYPVHELLQSSNNLISDDSLIGSDYYFSQDRTNESSHHRYKRDSELLEAYPNKDLRVHHYLSQTYSNMRDYQNLYRNAKETLKYVVEGKYIDYLFYAYVYLGVSSAHICPSEARRHFLTAYKYSVNVMKRCEPLHLYAGHLYNCGRYHEAYLFAKAACAIPEPQKEHTRYFIVQKKHYEERWLLLKAIEEQMFSHINNELKKGYELFGNDKEKVLEYFEKMAIELNSERRSSEALLYAKTAYELSEEDERLNRWTLLQLIENEMLRFINLVLDGQFTFA